MKRYTKSEVQVMKDSELLVLAEELEIRGAVWIGTCELRETVITALTRTERLCEEDYFHFFIVVPHLNVTVDEALEEIERQSLRSLMTMMPHHYFFSKRRKEDHRFLFVRK